MILKRMTVLLIVTMIVWLAACKANVDLQLDEDFSYLTIGMPEEEAANTIEKALDKHIVNPQADLRQGEIVVTGDIKQQGSGRLIPGSLVLQLWAEHGHLQAKITSLDFAGWDAQPQALDNINQELAEGLARGAVNNHRSELTDVTIQDGALSFTAKTPRNR